MYVFVCFVHLFTPLFVNSLICPVDSSFVSFIHSFICSSIHPSIRVFFHFFLSSLSVVRFSFNRSFFYSLLFKTHLLFDVCIHSFLSFIRSLLYSVIHSFVQAILSLFPSVHAFIYSFIRPSIRVFFHFFPSFSSLLSFSLIRALIRPFFHSFTNLSFLSLTHFFHLLPIHDLSLRSSRPLTRLLIYSFLSIHYASVSSFARALAVRPSGCTRSSSSTPQTSKRK